MMKINFRASALAALSLVSFSAYADLYSDATGDIVVPGGAPPNSHMDIASVLVTNTLTDISFQVNLVGDPVSPNWAKYNIIMRSPVSADLDMSADGNAWGRNYALAGGANRFIAGWTDQVADNSQGHAFAAGGWSQTSTFSSVIGTNSVTYTVSLASLGLVAGNSLRFDVVTTGGGDDGAVDALSNPNPQITDWSQSSVVAGLDYRVAAVPEPASMIALGVGAAALLRRRRK